MNVPFRRHAVFCGMVLATMLAALSAVHAQQTLGSISGTVLDNSGGAVVGATITIVNDQAAAKRAENSGAAGIYLFKDLAVGSYSFTISAEGYSNESIPSIPVQANRTATINIKLHPGAVSQTVEVSATPLLNATEPPTATCWTRTRL
jgi:hypothetical protein